MRAPGRTILFYVMAGRGMISFIPRVIVAKLLGVEFDSFIQKYPLLAGAKLIPSVRVYIFLVEKGLIDVGEGEGFW